MSDSEVFLPSDSGFPTVRLRRLRYHPGVRRLVRSTDLSADKLILPLFVRPGQNIRQPIASMPGNFQLSIDELVKEVQECVALGIGGIMLFGIPAKKDAEGTDAMSDDGIIAQAVRAVRKVVDDKFLIITDLCFCEYTEHGHCGVLTRRGVDTCGCSCCSDIPSDNNACGGNASDKNTSDNNAPYDVDNDKTLVNIVKQALVHARAGADMIAPSGMIDGMIGAIRQGLDRCGFQHIPIMSYAAKYASAFYGPFRDAAESAPQFGDRRSYQMDPASDPYQAIREVELDIQEGADIVMVKPALPYLDIVRMVRDEFPGIPLAAYHVSGEFSMIKAAAERGWIDEKRIVTESLMSVTRAGASIIITYFAKDVANWLK